MARVWFREEPESGRHATAAQAISSHTYVPTGAPAETEAHVGTRYPTGESKLLRISDRLLQRFQRVKQCNCPVVLLQDVFILIDLFGSVPSVLEAIQQHSGWRRENGAIEA
jgi:hypothetical protein